MTGWTVKALAASLMIATALSYGGTAAPAAGITVAAVQEKLYAGELAPARAALEAQLLQSPQDDQARMALGTIQFLQAIEHMSQSMYRYSLRAPRHDALIPLLPFSHPRKSPSRDAQL